MTDRSDEIARRASNNRFRRERAALVDALRALVGPRVALEPLADADRAAALAAEALAAYRSAEAQEWTIVHSEWRSDALVAMVEFCHAVSAALGARAVWLILPGREPQVVPVSSELVLDNPLGFAALGDYEFMLLDQALPAGLALLRHSHHWGPEQTTYSWEAEAWGAEPWLSVTTRALREQQGDSSWGAD
ncbi:MAG TPA: hypothetical protein VFJ96_14550 [Gemmatimonadaceae bacterium]|nr:hypothetical protein [Gemmatimonadaceae bacterium]